MIHYKYYDRGSGPALLLIHGMFGDHRDWEPVLEPLAARYRLLAVDLPGFGDSEKPDGDYTAERFVTALDGLRADLGIHRLSVVGNSFGGVVALLYTLARPEHVERLVLVSSGGFHRYSRREKLFHSARLSEVALRSLSPPVQGALLRALFINPSEASERYIQKQNDKLSRPDYPEYVRAAASSIRLVMNTYLLDRVSEIECPVLLVWGEQDVVVPIEEARAALERMRDARLVVLSHCGHAPQLDCPERFVSTLDDFLETTAGQKAA
jgi:pimeloyl-ACP methyl ester carboxylesterase